jgi:hypothetical protein
MERRPKPAFNARRREREWLELNGPSYAGQWVAVEGDYSGFAKQHS